MSSFRVTVELNASSSETWEYFFNQLNNWWPNTFFTSQKTKRFIIETIIGGKVYEDFGEGYGLIWGEVIGVDYPNSVQIKGQLTKEFGGPCISFEKFSFEETSSGCTMSYEVDLIGKNDDSTVASLEKGWKEILQVHFINYCKKEDN